MTLNPKQFHMHLYHGTSAENAESIKAVGLGGHIGGGGNVFLTHDPELAEDYANNFENPAVVTVRVNPRNLAVDWNSFDEPVYSYDDTGKRRGFDPSKLRHEGKDWKNSLKETGAVVHLGKIPPENILSIE